MAKILIFLETSPTHQLKKSQTDLLQFCTAEHEVSVFVASSASTQQIQELLKPYKVLSIQHIALKDPFHYENFFTPGLKIIEEIKPQFIFGISSSKTLDVFPRWAAQLNSILVSDVSEMFWKDQTLLLKRALYAGKCFAQIEMKPHPIGLVLFRPNQITSSSNNFEFGQGENPPVNTYPHQDQNLLLTLKEVVSSTLRQTDLTEAQIIVSGGRGLQNKDNFKLVEELAETLRASVGASRAVVDEGWVPHSLQVGQTGKTVTPSLYFALGISGAVQHLAGMSRSRVIVAVNNNPDAPIFQHATYGIVGDVLQVVPLLIQEFRKVLNQ